MKALFTSLFFILFSSFLHGQTIRLRAKFYETNIGKTKTQEVSDRLIIIDLNEKKIKIYGNPTETFEIYETFEIDENTTMFPSIDKDGLEYAIELYSNEEFVYVTIQVPEENEFGTFDSRMYVCKLIQN